VNDDLMAVADVAGVNPNVPGGRGPGCKGRADGAVGAATFSLPSQVVGAATYRARL